MEHHILDYWEAFEELKTYLASSSFEFLALDTETDSTEEKLAKLFGIGLCFKEEETFYIPIRKNDKTNWWTQEQEQEIIAWVFEQCQKHKVIGHNIIYDVLVLYHNYGIDITSYVYSDTILQKHAVDEERPFGLKEVAVRYLGPESDKAQQRLYENIKKNGGKTTQAQMDMWIADTEVLGEYCAWDVHLTMRLFHLFEKRIHEEKLEQLFYKDEIMPLYREVTIPMKKKGFPVDVAYFARLNEEVTEEIDNLEHIIQQKISPLIQDFISQELDKRYPLKAAGFFPKYAAELLHFDLPRNKQGNITLARKEIDKLPEPPLGAHKNFLNWLKGNEDLSISIICNVQKYWYGKDNPDNPYIFNLKSPDHLKHIFFEKLSLLPLSKTETGEPQVDEDFLDSIKKDHAWVQELIDYKKLIKLKSTYIEGILERQISGIVYSSFKQFGPPSGRYASSNPNLQNLPRVKEEDSGLSDLVLKYVNSIKKGFIASKGCLIVNADYSQLEPRAFAEACGDPLLQQVFINNEDLYGSIAKQVWGLDCTPNEVKKKYPEKRQPSQDYCSCNGLWSRSRAYFPADECQLSGSSANYR